MIEEKNILRKKMIELRQKIPDSVRNNYSQSIIEKIEKLNIFQTSDYILLYWSMADEVNTHDMANKWKDKKKIILPVTLHDELELKQYTGEMQMSKTTRFNLLEPVGKNTISPDLIELVIVPGLAFDSNNNRLGYGKGYYDKLLTSIQAYKIGVCFNFQKLDLIPHEEHDIKMDLIITNF